jgi:predicted lipid-binding transport protein (Tim44 family)
MIKSLSRTLAVLTALFFITVAVTETAFARAGGGSSSGSRGSRSYSSPSRSYSQPSRSYSQPNYSRPNYSQPAGGFLRGLAGGIAGGFLGSMLFRGIGFAGGGGWGGGGGGIGILEILIIAGLGFMVYRMYKRRRSDSGDRFPGNRNGAFSGNDDYEDRKESNIAHIKANDGDFDENRFKDSVMDMFFRIQAAWMNRDLTPVKNILTEEMRATFQRDIDSLLESKKINRLENIAVRSVEITEAWRESDQDYITTLVYANLLDYTVDETSGNTISGSRTEPSKFEEYWTFTRPSRNSQWMLTAIAQA